MPVPAKRKKPPGALYARLSGIVLLGTDRAVPTEFRIFKAGDNPSEKGNFVFDEASALSVMEEYAAHNKPMLLDYNHGTTLEAATPEQSIAAGEFVPEIRNGELWAKSIKWTERAFALLKAGEYRLFSPYFKHDKDGRVERLINVALTNLPALDGIPALVAANANPDNEDPMSECASCSALNAKLSAQDEELKALKAKLGFFDEKKKDDEVKATALSAAVTSLTALTGETSHAAALGTVSAWKTKAEAHDKLAADMATLEATTLRAELAAVLDGGITAGKVAPAAKESLEKAALGMGGGKPSKDGVAWATAHIAALPKIVPTKEDEKKPPGDGSGIVLNDVDRHYARLSGMTDEATLAAKKRIALAGR